MRNSNRLAFIHLKWAPVVGATAMIALGAMNPPDGRGGGGGGKGGTPPAKVTDLAVTDVTHDSIIGAVGDSRWRFLRRLLRQEPFISRPINLGPGGDQCRRQQENEL